MDDNIYTLYTDGSCFGNPGPGGVGSCLVFPVEFGMDDLNYYRGYHITTNNRMELRAGIDGLKIARYQIKLHGYRKLGWYTDSKHIEDNFYNVDQWRRNRWIRSNSEPVLNVDLWRKLHGLIRSMQVSPIWISRDLNKKADLLARRGAKNPTYTDFGYNPGRVGTSLGRSRSAPNLFDKNEHVLVRIYKGDGVVSRTDSKCKIRFETIDVKKGSPIAKYYAYAEQEIYNRLHRSYEYIVDVFDGDIIKIIEEL